MWVLNILRQWHWERRSFLSISSSTKDDQACPRLQGDNLLFFFLSGCLFFHFYSSSNIVFFRRWVLIPVSRPLLLTVFTTTSNTSTSYFRYFVKFWHFRYFDNKSSIVIYFRIEGEATQSRATSTTKAPPPWRATLRWYSIILQSITGISEFKTICSLTWRWFGLAISQK